MSDRIEKESEESEVVKRLEWGGAKIVKGDWKKHITQELQEGLVLIYLTHKAPPIICSRQQLKFCCFLKNNK